VHCRGLGAASVVGGTDGYVLDGGALGARTRWGDERRARGGKEQRAHDARVKATRSGHDH